MSFPTEGKNQIIKTQEFFCKIQGSFVSTMTTDSFLKG